MSLIRLLVTTTAVIIESTIPISKVIAKPLIEPGQSIHNTIDAKIVVMLLSNIVTNARLKPVLIADLTVLPDAYSSLILSKIITFASTAIPIESMIPAIPGRVSSTQGTSARRSIISTVYIVSASDDAIPIPR